MALIVGLGGVTNGGKTTMCRSLQRVFSTEPYHLHVLCMHLDHYFRSPDDPNHVHLEQFNHHDWDSLNALHIDRFIDDLENNRKQCDLLLVEGFLIFNIPYPLDKNLTVFDLIYYFDLPFEECLRRRLDRNYDPPDPEGYFIGHVWNTALKAKKDAIDQFHLKQENLVNTGDDPFDQVERRIINDVNRILLRHS